MEPDQTLSTGAIAGRKKDKSQIYILFCTNATGSYKFRPLVIGKLLNPQCFKNFNRKILLLIDNVGFYFNPKIFNETENDFNNKENNEEEIVTESSYSAQNRKKVNKKKPDIKLSNIELIYLPSNTTAYLQPMDARIIYSFKSKYKKEYCKHLIRKFDAETGILPSCIDDDDVNFDLQNFEPDSDVTEIEDLLDNLLETDNVRNYFQILDHEISAKENLIEEQIVNLVQLENKEESEDNDDLNNEIPPISIKETVYSGLETFIPEFDVNNLRIF
ncbi:unnamed protein product [Rhizophagus irregularis]|uniref:DDE-1 domain-containing protein n=1 Tax=Rhizophagus irregularis TaxID=588596 RepID=A0A916EAZ5_9GLOM|nr:unnamed protein product [Rhizophagus irregularis]